MIYLVVLGVQRFRDTARQPYNRNDDVTKALSLISMFRKGFFVSAANPKAVVFFAGLFPIFLSPAADLLPQFLVLAVSFLVMDGTALLTYAMVGGNIRASLKRHDKEHWENRISGTMLIVAGTALASKKL